MRGCGPEGFIPEEHGNGINENNEDLVRMNAHRSSHAPGICQESLESAGHYPTNYSFWQRYPSFSHHQSMHVKNSK